MIHVENLCMNYGTVKAVNNISFDIQKGEVIGLLGLNGAGKSTTLKIVTTYLYPTSGKALVAGKDVSSDPIPIRKIIGYLPEQLPLYMDMQVDEYLRFVGNARGIHGDTLKRRLGWVVEKCGLKPMYCKPIRQLSKGYKQRTALAQALIHDPEIVILDEPTSGLDPHQILEVRALIKELSQTKTIIFSTHILQEVEAMTNRIIVINRGQIVADGNRTEIQRQSMGSKRLQLTLEPGKSENEVVQALSRLSGIKKVEKKRTDSTGGEKKQLDIYWIDGALDGDTQATVAKFIREQNWNFYELKHTPFTLEEVFLDLTGHRKSENQ